MGDYFTAASIAFDKVSPRKSSPFAGWKNLAAMLLSQLAIKLESDTFVEPRYVALDGRKRRSVFRPNEAGSDAHAGQRRGDERFQSRNFGITLRRALLRKNYGSKVRHTAKYC